MIGKLCTKNCERITIYREWWISINGKNVFECFMKLKFRIMVFSMSSCISIVVSVLMECRTMIHACSVTRI